jgi:conjugal transfer pilus assembly protein TraF
MKRTFALLALLGTLGPVASQQTASLRADDPRRGWHFYDDAVTPVPVRKLTAPKVIDSSQAITRYKALQRAVEEARIVAVMAPTVENVRTYLELEARILRDASRFADVAKRVAWMSPELDPSAQTRPSATFAVDVYERQQAAERRTLLDTLAREHIILFFFRGDCPYCHAFAPVLKAFESRYGLQVSAVSTDGGTLPEFPHPRGDNGISQILKVQQVPALFLAHPASGRIVPLGFGVMSENELADRIVATAPSQNAPALSALPK